VGQNNKARIERKTGISTESYRAETGPNYQKSDLTESSSAPVTTPIQFKVLPDGTVIDLVKNPEDPENLQLAIWKEGKTRIASEFVFGSQRFVPVVVPPSLLGAVGFPTGVQEFTSPTDLLSDIGGALTLHVDFQDETDAPLVAACAMATWVSDVLPVYPYLAISGPFGSGKSTLLRFLQATCRRGIILSDYSPSTLYTLPGVLKPTLLLDECEFDRTSSSKEVQRILRAGSSRDMGIERHGKMHDVACSKVISSRDRIPDAALASRAIHVFMLPYTKPKPTLDVNHPFFTQLQNKLLAYRFKYRDGVDLPEYLVAGDYSPRVRELALALAAPLSGDPGAQQVILSLFDKQNREADEDRMRDSECLVLNALWRMFSTKIFQPVYYVGELAHALKVDATGSNLSARRVGSILRSLGFNLRRDSSGYGIENDKNLRVLLERATIRLGMKVSC
jgi:hypothetical protein